jgi:hypothetical protein
MGKIMVRRGHPPVPNVIIQFHVIGETSVSNKFYIRAAKFGIVGDFDSILLGILEGVPTEAGGGSIHGTTVIPDYLNQFAGVFG